MESQTDSPPRITIILDPCQRKDLDDIAAAEQISVAAVGRRAIREFLARHAAAIADGEREAVPA